MHFIEDWFGISPDGGNGMLEVAYIVALGLLVVGIASRRRLRARLRRAPYRDSSSE